MKRHPLERTVSRQWWVITVAGYGDFAFYGTEDESEEMRRHKARWEGGVGRKRLAADDDPLVQRQTERVKREVELGYPRASERERAETEAALTANTGANPRA
jgi:hypothetical protein